MTTTKEAVAAVRAALEKATPGPWSDGGLDVTTEYGGGRVNCLGYAKESKDIETGRVTYMPCLGEQLPGSNYCASHLIDNDVAYRLYLVTKLARIEELLVGAPK